MSVTRRPSLEASIAEIAERLRRLERTPGRWVYFGTYPGDPDTTEESPAFANGYENAASGSGFPPMRFKVDKWRMVDIEGAPINGTPGAAIGEALPTEYRPPYSLRFVCASQSGGTVNLQVDPDGLIYVVP